ncbi:hypothetical protein DFH09DRAFT_1413147 [Mycena vulgaris]|nr:hypothetical protein DFH09DRAFT_1413147 [Mycena vulgaris]
MHDSASTPVYSAYSAVVQLYAHDPLCRVGCDGIEDDHHIFVTCTRYTEWRIKAAAELHKRTNAKLAEKKIEESDHVESVASPRYSDFGHLLGASCREELWNLQYNCRYGHGFSDARIRDFILSAHREFILSTTFPSSDVLPILDSILEPREPGYLDKVLRLTVGVNPETCTQAHRLIAAIANTLLHLEIRCGGLPSSLSRPAAFPNMQTGFLAPLELPPLPDLRTLKLKVHLGHRTRLQQNLYTALACFPAVLPSIEVVKLAFYRFSIDTWEPDDCGPLPALNSFRTELPCLRHVVCHLYLKDLATPHADFLDYIRGKLSGLSEKGMLTLSHGVIEDN